jgi:uncharacterized protein
MNPFQDNQPAHALSMNEQTMARQFFSKVYIYMLASLLVSGVIAYVCGTPEFIMKYFYTPTGSRSLLLYIVMFLPIPLALVMQIYMEKIAYPLLLIGFILYSILIGLALTGIFAFFSIGSITATFLITAGTFTTMAILGFTTKLDLTRFGSIMYMLFIGIFIASIVNFWMHSEFLSYAISIIGIFVFTGLTAYYMQNLKQIALDPSIPEEEKNKWALIGGFKLYITFINLFLSLLRLFGSEE